MYGECFFVTYLQIFWHVLIPLLPANRINYKFPSKFPLQTSISRFYCIQMATARQHHLLKCSLPAASSEGTSFYSNQGRTQLRLHAAERWCLVALLLECKAPCQGAVSQGAALSGIREIFSLLACFSREFKRHGHLVTVRVTGFQAASGCFMNTLGTFIISTLSSIVIIKCLSQFPLHTPLF